MKKILIFLLSLATISVGYSQVIFNTKGQVIDNRVFEDCEGNISSIDDLLAEGKPLIIFASTVDCGYCFEEAPEVSAKINSTMDKINWLFALLPHNTYPRCTGQGAGDHDWPADWVRRYPGYANAKITSQPGGDGFWLIDCGVTTSFGSIDPLSKKIIGSGCRHDGMNRAVDAAMKLYSDGILKRQNTTVVKPLILEVKDVEVREDMLAAARGLCGDQKGVVSILGTGSNSCYYDGKKMKSLFLSLGYIAGDEGSGNHMGKRILQYYNYQTFDTELRMSFEQLFGNDIGGMINRLHAEAFPNRYLASFVPLLLNNRGHYMVENIIEDCINDFFHAHILKYRQSWKYPLFFTGSIAYEFKDVIADICGQYELDLGKVVKSPMDGLVKYHQALL